MKKILPLLLSIFLTSCDQPIIHSSFSKLDSSEIENEIKKDANYGKYDIEHYLYIADTSSCNFDSFYQIDDMTYKVFTDADEYNSFLSFIEKDSTEADYFNKRTENFDKEIDFTVNKVAVLATYVDHSDASVSVSSIVSSESTITTNMFINIYSPGVAQSLFSFLFLILEKDDNRELLSNYRTINNYDQNLCYKPIIYFYPTEEMDLSIKYVNEEKLLTTYPKYNDGWDIHVKENGIITTNNDNREYYALYFDEIASYLTDFSIGFYVSKDNAITFLEEKLDYIGLTNREANEFIMYWLPILENNENSIVYFEQNETRNTYCPLEFSITPDSMIRTIIHIKKVDGPVDIQEQQLISYNRSGFTVVEWGGITY